MNSAELITEEWLKEVGFRWHQLERQPSKHWLLWLGGAIEEFLQSIEDLGVEVASDLRGGWYCWIRADTSHRYSRFVHVRHIRERREVIAIVEALSGQPWNPANHISGCVYTAERVARWRAEENRLDRQMLRDGPKWRDIEKDDTRGGALPEHLDAHEKSRGGV